MAENNFVLFKRDDQDQDSNEDAWDDSALIQAYDRAVNLAKEKVASQLSLEEEAPESTSSDVPEEEQSVSPSKASKKWSWKVGDHVRSVYSEDGVEYEAIIKKIKQANSTCLVRYLGYDNEEVVFIKDLKPSSGLAARNQQIVAAGEVAPESSSDMECEGFQSPSKPVPNIAGLDWQPVKPEPLIPNFAVQNHSMSSIPPPPPPSAWPAHGTAEMDSDSLYSMLMSWYMAGYHTGYYQGVQQRNKRKANNTGTS